MKRKILSVLLILALVLGLGLVVAVPAVAAATGELCLSDKRNGTAEWSDAEQHAGSHSIELAIGADDAGGIDDAYLKIKYGEVGIDLTVAELASEWSWWVKKGAGSAAEAPYAVICVSDGTNAEADKLHFEPLYDTDYASVDTSTWYEFESADATTWDTAWYDMEIKGVESAGNNHSLQWFVDTDDSTGPGAGGNGHDVSGTDKVTWIQIIINDPAYINTTVYVDDLTIDTTAYDLELPSGPLTVDDDRGELASASFTKIQDAIDLASDGDTIQVYAGTYDAETSWPIDVDVAGLTIESVSGAASTTIAPGSAGQGVIAISADNVTIDDFTITGGSQSYSPSNPQEHTVWVAANYSTISNNTIINYRGNQAGLYIGGRNDPGTESPAIYSYNVSKPLGHTIEDNSFRQAGSGEGWGIFAYDLTDSLIHGNTFVGEYDVGDGWSTPWNTNEGAPGTAILITNATAGTATGSPGEGYVVIEDNTAQYIKYGWLTFVAMYPYIDAAGYGYEQPVVSEVDKVIVRNNIVHNIAQKADDSGWSTAVNFSAGIKSDAYGIKGASLTIGENKVTFTGNSLYDSDLGFEVGEAEAFTGGTLSHAGVLNADNIGINYNLIYNMHRFGIEHAGRTNTVGTVGQAAKTIDAESNWWDDIYGPSHAGNPYDGPTTGDIVSDYVDYSPWMIHTTLASGWNIYSPPWAPDTSTDTPDEALDITGTDSGNVDNAYYFNSSASTPAWAIATSLTPLEAIYLEMSAASTIDVAFSPSYTAPPSRTMYQGWNLFGPASFVAMDVDDALGDAYWGTGEASLVGYNHVESLAINQTAVWTFLRPGAMYSGNETPPDVLPTEGYWVYMVNQGTLGGFTYTPIAIDTTTE